MVTNLQSRTQHTPPRDQTSARTDNFALIDGEKLQGGFGKARSDKSGSLGAKESADTNCGSFLDERLHSSGFFTQAREEAVFDSYTLQQY